MAPVRPLLLRRRHLLSLLPGPGRSSNGVRDRRAAGPARRGPGGLPGTGLLLLAALVVAASPGLAPVAAALQAEQEEEILAFDVEVELEDEGVMTVTESITVRALGRQIRRGIFRDIPTRFPRSAWGGTIVAPLEVLSVERNGSPEPYDVSTVKGPEGRSGVRVRIGNASVLLDEGVHRYTLVYRTERWMRFGEARDSLTWNVTGNGWDFPIREASARIRLPGGVATEDVGLDAWTGLVGETGSHATASWDAGANAAVFRTTQPLWAREGLTVKVAAPAGVVAPPTAARERAWFRLDWGGYLDAGVAVAAVLLLYLGLWVRVGRDPAGGPTVVRYRPPEGFSPAALGFVRERGFDPSQLTAAVVNLAVKGAVTIERDDDTWTVRPTGTLPEDLSKEEKDLHRRLVGTSPVVLTGSSNSAVRSAVSRFRSALEGRLESRYFVLNRRWFVSGAVGSALAFAVVAWRYRWDVAPEAWFLGFWLTFWTMGVATLLWRVVQAWGETLRGRVASGPGALFLTLFSLPFLGAEVVVGGLLYQRIPGHLVVAALAIGAVNVLFYHLLERPTLKGRGLLDGIEGFRRFLEGTEEDRLDRLQDPDRPLELFERFLPFAIALGVENRWAARFEEALTPVEAATAGVTTSPAWYSGSGGVSSLGGFTSSLGSSFSSTLSSSSAAPSSSGSSGGGFSSGGGGFSGGGGGGGGGGGW